MYGDTNYYLILSKPNVQRLCSKIIMNLHQSVLPEKLFGRYSQKTGFEVIIPFLFHHFWSELRLKKSKTL